MSNPVSSTDLTISEETAGHEENAAKAKDALDVSNMLRKAIFDAYKNGEITFAVYCKLAKDIVYVEHIQFFTSERMLGASVKAALECTPTKRKTSSRRVPEWFLRVSAPLVDLVAKNEGLLKIRISRTDKATAFERTAEVMNMRGCRWATASTVQKAWGKYRNIADTP